MHLVRATCKAKALVVQRALEYYFDLRMYACYHSNAVQCHHFYPGVLRLHNYTLKTSALFHFKYFTYKPFPIKSTAVCLPAGSSWISNCMHHVCGQCIQNTGQKFSFLASRTSWKAIVYLVNRNIIHIREKVYKLVHVIVVIQLMGTLGGPPKCVRDVK